MNLYMQIFNLIRDHIFGGTIAVGSYEELVTILFSTCAVFFAVAIPFIAIFAFCRFLFGFSTRW